jgi:hypothetical protein
MPLLFEAVSNARADIDRLSPEIEGWTNDFLELLQSVTNLDLIFQEAKTMDLNYVALCRWDDPSNLTVIQTIPATQTTEERKRTLATTSILAAVLHASGHHDVAVALLSDNEGKMFRHEGIVGRCRAIRGCGRVPLASSRFDFSSIHGHKSIGARPLTELH